MSNLPAKGYRIIGIDTQIPWPAQERIVCFRGRKFHFLPGSGALGRMIRVQTCEGFTQEHVPRWRTAPSALFNAAAAGELLERFVEFRSGHSTI
jgi:hypothetical protein